MLIGAPTRPDTFDFRTEVLEASMSIPVLVDFWAPWCGPCKVLGPLLEKLEAEAKGQWKLVKIDTEEYPELAQAFQISSIPAVKLLYQQQLIGEFNGALPEPQLRQWLSQMIPTEAKDLLVSAREAKELGEYAVAMQAVQRLLQEDPNNHQALMLGAELAFSESPEQALAMLDRIPQQEQSDAAQAMRTLAELLGQNPDVGDTPAAQAYARGCIALKTHQYPQACEAWIESIGHQRSFQEEAARKACVALFQWLGHQNPVTQEYRRRLASVLF